MSQRSFLYKYRGVVEDNQDPQKKGRLKVNVPDVMGNLAAEDITWARPCIPYAGPDVGFFFIPPVGAQVWVEYEGGDPDYPIWTGCFWGDNDDPPVPRDAAAEDLPNLKVLKTSTGSLTFNDSDQEPSLTIEFTQGGEAATVVIDTNGIEITYRQDRIRLSGSKVSINGNALEVT